MTVIVLLGAAIFLLLVILAEMCVLAHRLEEIGKQPKYDVHMNVMSGVQGSAATEDAIRQAMLRPLS